MFNTAHCASALPQAWGKKVRDARAQANLRRAEAAGALAHYDPNVVSVEDDSKEQLERGCVIVCRQQSHLRAAQWARSERVLIWAPEFGVLISKHAENGF